jgi:hypothetical protein
MALLFGGTSGVADQQTHVPERPASTLYHACRDRKWIFYEYLVKKADLTITSAEWTGLTSGADLHADHTRAVMVCSDPVVPDGHSPEDRISI